MTALTTAGLSRHRRLPGTSRVARIRLLCLLVAIVLWELSATVGPLSQYNPHVWELAGASARIVTDDNIGTHLWATLKVLFVGSALGSFAGVAVGLVVASSRHLRVVFEPLIVYLGAIPKIVLFPIFVFFFAIGTTSRIGLTTLSAFFPVVVQTLGSAWLIRPIWIRAATMLGAGPVQRVLRVAFPTMLPSILTGIRLGVAAGIIGTLAAETKFGNEGIGYLVVFHYSRYQLAEMYAVVLLVFLAASALSITMDALLRRVVRSERRGAGQTVTL